MAENFNLYESVQKEESRPPVHTTDLFNCEMMVKQWGDRIHFVHQWARWLVWTGRRWAPDVSGKIYRYARDTVRHLYTMAGEELNESERKKLAGHALRSENRQKIMAMVSLAESEYGIPLQPEQFDADPWLFNTISGTIDLRTGKLKEHDKDELLTKISPVKYDLDESPWCPTWYSFLDRVMGGNERLISFLKRTVGYSLTGDTREQCFFFLHGSGANGKSTFIETIKALMGDYGCQARPEIILLKRNEGVPNEIASLRGRRFVATVEVEQGRRFAESLLKQLTGGDTVSARHLYSEFFEFVPEFKLFFVANHKPIIRGTDRAIWRRVRLIPWTVSIPEEEQDREMLIKLKAELPGILKWSVEGCLEWQKEGLHSPDEVRKATESYREESDILAEFLEDDCIINPTAQVSVKSLYNAYLQWCERNGERPESKKSIGERLYEKGFDQYQKGKNRIRHWIGLGLLNEK